jgi:hypothetical protein
MTGCKNQAKKRSFFGTGPAQSGATLLMAPAGQGLWKIHGRHPTSCVVLAFSMWVTSSKRDSSRGPCSPAQQEAGTPVSPNPCRPKDPWQWNCGGTGRESPFWSLSLLARQEDDLPARSVICCLRDSLLPRSRRSVDGGRWNASALVPALTEGTNSACRHDEGQRPTGPQGASHAFPIIS